jgi:hypothetical protein
MGEGQDQFQDLALYLLIDHLFVKERRWWPSDQDRKESFQLKITCDFRDVIIQLKQES